MSNKQKKSKAAPKAAPKVAAPAKAAPMPFGRKNYTFLIVAVVLIIAGFLSMALEQAEYGFGVWALWVGPILLMAGFVVGVFAILAKPETSEENSNS